MQLFLHSIQHLVLKGSKVGAMDNEGIDVVMDCSMLGRPCLLWLGGPRVVQGTARRSKIRDVVSRDSLGALGY